MEQTENLSLSSAVIRCDTPESAAEQRIMERINTSLHNGGMCVYNCHIEGDDNEYDTPKVVKAHEALGIEEGEEFYGWEGYERITMLDFQKVTLSEQHPIGEYITLSEDTRKMMAGNRRDHFDWHKPETAMIAIRMEMPDGSWYEYVMNRTV